MLIDRSHRGWFAVTVLVLLVSWAAYVVYSRSWPGGPSGRTWPGMLFGVLALALMVFAALLAVRKKTVRLRMGNLTWWLKGHLWMGVLSIALVFFHAAFRWGGTLEIAMWLALAAVTISGIVGLVLQNVLPRTMNVQLPYEIIPDQFAEVCNRLVLSTDTKIVVHCGSAAVEAVLQRSRQNAPSPEADPKGWLADFYIHSVRPFLSAVPPGDSPFANSQQAQLTFDNVRTLISYESLQLVNSLEEICRERRQLGHQERLYRWLHGWLKVHVPCSIALLVFIVVHVVASLYY